MSSTTFRTDESPVMINYDTFLMSVDGMKDLFSPILFDVFMEGTAFAAATSVFDPYFFIDDAFVFKLII